MSLPILGPLLLPQDRSATQLGPVLRRMGAAGGVRGLFRGNMATVGGCACTAFT